MTIQDGGGGDAAPFPVIPAPISGDDNLDASGTAKLAWDVVAVMGPLPRNEFYWLVPSVAWSTREYQRWHGRKPTTDGAAHRWACDRALDEAIDKGWLLVVDDQLTVGEIPPDHRPMGKLAMGQVPIMAATKVDKPAELIDIRKLQQLLTSKKWQDARRKPDRKKKAALKASIDRIGVIYPILVWSPPMSSDEIIIDGVTRQELIDEINAGRPQAEQINACFDGSPLRRHLTDTSAYEAALARIEAELHGTSKGQSEDDFATYLVALESLGLTYQEIGDYVNLTRAAVKMRLNRVKDVKRISPSQRDPHDDIDEFVRLRDQGYYQTDIARMTGWSQTTVHHMLREHDERQVAEAAGVEADVLPKDDLGRFIIERAVFDLPDQFIAGDIGYTDDGQARNGRRRVNELITKNLLRNTGKKGGSKGQSPIYEVTELARALITERQVTKVPPLTLVEPVEEVEEPSAAVDEQVVADAVATDADDDDHIPQWEIRKVCVVCGVSEEEHR